VNWQPKFNFTVKVKKHPMKIIIALLFLTLFDVGYGQSDSKLIEVFGLEEVNDMKVSNPGAYAIFKAFSADGVELIDGLVDKYETFGMLPTIHLRSTSEEVEQSIFLNDVLSDNFNPLKYDLFPTRQIQIYKIESGKYLRIQSQQNLLNTNR